MSAELVMAITGASGAIYALRLLEILLQQNVSVHLVISPSGQVVLRHELGIAIDLDHFQPLHALHVVGSTEGVGVILKGLLLVFQPTIVWINHAQRNQQRRFRTTGRNGHRRKPSLFLQLESP